MRSGGACSSPENGGTSCTRSSCGAAAPSPSKRCIASSGQIHSNGQLALRHNHAPMDKGCDSAHAPSWPLAMCRRAGHASLQRTAWAEHGAKQPRLIGTGRSAWHVLVIGTSAHQASPTLTLVQERVCWEYSRYRNLWSQQPVSHACRSGGVLLWQTLC